MSEGKGGSTSADSAEAPTILVVDDKDDHREIVSATLEGSGYRILEAADADSALALVRRERPDLVFLDLQLTGSDIDGVQLLGMLKREQPALRVVAYTAWAIPEWREKAYAAGCDEYLVKPMELAEVRKVTARYLGAVAQPPPPGPADGAPAQPYPPAGEPGERYAVSGRPQDLMAVGIVQPMAFPAAQAGEKLLESVRWLAGTGYFAFLEITHIPEEATRRKLQALVRQEHLQLLYAAQPVLLGEGLSLNHPEPAERTRALTRMEACIEEAASVEAGAVAVLSGPNPAPGDRPAQLDLLVESLLHLCRAAALSGDLPILLENFDQLSFGKNCLVGPTAEAAEVVRRVREGGGYCGLLVDLSHLPLLGESPEEALGPAADVLEHVHIGNCVMRHPEHPAYGDNHPVFATPEGENGVEELSAFLRQLFRVGYLSSGSVGGEPRRRWVSLEVKPFGLQRPEEVVTESQRVLDEAWQRV